MPAPLLILQDAAQRPLLFWWNGGMDDVALDAWLLASPLCGKCPPDLRTLWLATGGGEAFETETIFGPSGKPTLEQDLLEVNAMLRERGLPDRFVVFARTCLGLGAVDLIGSDLVQLTDTDFSVEGRFATLDSWYVHTVRREFAGRYALDALDCRESDGLSRA